MTSLARLFWPLCIASLVVDGYAIAVMEEGAWYAAAAFMCVTLISYCAEDEE